MALNVYVIRESLGGSQVYICNAHSTRGGPIVNTTACHTEDNFTLCIQVSKKKCFFRALENI